MCALRGAGAGRAFVFCVMSILAAWDEDTAEAWLKGVTVIDAREIRCPAKVVEVLLLSFKDAGWDESDVPPSSSPLSKRDEGVWLDVLDEAATAQSETVTKADRTRFVRWLASREEEDVDDASYRPSSECRNDMAGQGALAYTDLLFLDASRHLGRPAGKGDLVGAEYGVPPSQCKGGKDAVKYKAETFTTELDKARQQKEVGHLHSFVMGACGALNRSEHRFATKAASLIMEWFMRGCAAMEAWGALAVLYYFEEYLRVYRGRGLPVLYDAEIASRSQGRGKQGSAPKSFVSGFDGRMGQDASSQDDSSRALSEQMAELLKAQTQIASSVSSMSGQVSRLQSEVAAVKSAQAAPGAPSGSGFVPFMQRACHHCGEKGHVIADCPERKEKEKNKKKGDDSDA